MSAEPVLSVAAEKRAAPPPLRRSSISEGVRELPWRTRGWLQDADWLTRIALIVFAFQLFGLMAWSWVLYSRYALTWDYSIYHQAWYEIARGHLDPYSSVARERFWRNDGEFLLWPLALIGVVFRSGLALIWSQDVAIVLGGWVVFRWAREIAGARGCGSGAAGFGALALVLLVANPWIYWSISFDWHFEALDTLLALLLARALWHGRTRVVAVIGFLLLLGGAPAALLVVGVGLGGLLLSGRRRLGLALVITGSVWTLGLSAVGGAAGAGVTTSYGYLAGSHRARLTTGRLMAAIATHPLRVLRAWWLERVDAFAMVAPAGLLGVIAAPAVGLVLVVLLSADLYGTATVRIFASTPFQSLPAMYFVVVGTIWVLARARRRLPRRGVTTFVAAAAGAYSVLWAAVWVPQIPRTWLRISPSGSAALAEAQGKIPRSAEVIASQGVMGRFSGRRWIYPVFGPGAYPVKTRPIFLIIAPQQGIEVSSVHQSLGALKDLAGPLHAQLIFSRSGVWLWRWTPPPGVHQLDLTPQGSAVPAWALNSPSGHAVLSGPPAWWYLASSGRAGYVASGAYWRELPGSYKARVVVATSSPITVEVWDDTNGKMLARRRIVATAGYRSVVLPFSLDRLHPPNVYTGWGPARLKAFPRRPGDHIEIRVFSTGSGTVNVRSLDLLPA